MIGIAKKKDFIDRQLIFKVFGINYSKVVRDFSESKLINCQKF